MTERIIKVFRHLYVKGKVKSKSDFCRKINYSPQSWYDVENDRREFPPGKIPDLVRAFNISKEYIFYNRQPIITPKYTRKPKQLVNN